MLIRRPADIRPSEITDKDLYANRWRFMQGAAAAALATGVPGLLSIAAPAPGKAQLPPARNSPYSTSEPLNSFKDITAYNNFYELGTDKYSPAQRAKSLRTRPWAVKVSGEVKRPLIAAGFPSFVLMIPLAATSTDRMVRRLGGKRWQQLHRAVYLVAVAGVIHFWWLVKIDYTHPLVYSIIVGALLVTRLVFRHASRVL